MKLSISLPNSMAKEILYLAEKEQRPVSWYLQQAWDFARSKLVNPKSNFEKQKKKAMKQLLLLRGSLAKAYPNTDSVTLSHKAFHLKDR